MDEKLQTLLSWLCQLELDFSKRKTRKLTCVVTGTGLCKLVEEVPGRGQFAALCSSQHALNVSSTALYVLYLLNANFKKEFVPHPVLNTSKELKCWIEVSEPSAHELMEAHLGLQNWLNERNSRIKLNTDELGRCS